MSQSLSPDLLLRTRQILLPLVATADEREALLTEAFYLHDPLLYRIERQGAPYPFAVNCIKTLLDYGCLAEREHSLARLLSIARTLYGVDKHREIDELTQLANALCQADTHETRQPVVLTPPVEPAAVQTIATPRDERQPSVFLSYAHADATFANRLMDDLRAAGHSCWIDTSALKGGDEWLITIAEGIINSYAMVVVVTPAALQSRWVRDEILWARQKQKLIIPVLLADVFDETRFFPLVGAQGLKFFDREYDAALPELLRALPNPNLPNPNLPNPNLPNPALPERADETLPLADGGAASSPVAVTQIRSPRTVPRTLELGYLERLKLEELLNTEKYTPLGGSSQQQVRRAEMRAVFELLPMRGREHQALHERRRFENAVEEIRRMRRAVLLGEPGGGKTTTIWKLAAELVADAVADRAAPLPLLIRLGRWTQAEQPLDQFIAAQLGELGDYLDVLLSERRAALLLDGLNELPASQHRDKYPQVQQFIETHPQLLAVVSCRELDYTIDLAFDRINITPLDPLRIREFVGRYLGEAPGEALFWRIGGGDEIQKVWEVWQKAGASFEQFWTATDIPKDQPNVFGATSGEHDRIWQEKVRGQHSLIELARNPYMLLMLTSVYAEQGTLPDNRGELFELFVQTLLKRERIADDEQVALVDGLARVAFEMQTRRSADEAGDALTVLPKAEVKTILNDRLLYLAGSASLLSVGEQVRFTHQLLQEYFAARCMDIKMNTPAVPFAAQDIWLSERWWQRTNWEEAAILLAGLYSNDCTPVIDWVARGNPEVAAQCIVRSGAALADATRERLRAAWLERLTDLRDEPSPLGRAAVGRALALTGWDNRRGVALTSEGLPDIEWIEIPAGAFKYGDNNEIRTLPTYHLSRYPVTYTQFQVFLDAADGYHDARWWDGLAAKADDRQPNEQRFKFANHPRETVSWYEAMAFCRWLSWRCGGGFDLRKVDEWLVRLPTEFEWEKAARGTDGRLYPYGNEFDATRGNVDDTGLGQTSAVGIFPHGASPYGVEEMSGNVWEWCLSNYEKPTVELRDEKLETDERRVLRGGAWYHDQYLARAVYRNHSPPGNRYYSFGFRVVVSRPPS